MLTLTTRRAMLAGAAATPIALAQPAAAAAITSAHRGWDQCVADYRAAKARFDAASARHDELEARYARVRREMPKAPVDDRPYHLDMTVRELAQRPAAPGWAEYERVKAEVSADNDRLHLEIVGDAGEVFERELDRVSEALGAVAAYPVPTLALLAEKVDILLGEYAQDFGNGEEGRLVAADVRRLARGEG